MATYSVKVVVEYEYEVEADSEAEAEAEGWKYENYSGFASVDSIEVESNEAAKHHREVIATHHAVLLSLWPFSLTGEKEKNLEREEEDE